MCTGTVCVKVHMPCPRRRAGRVVPDSSGSTKQHMVLANHVLFFIEGTGDPEKNTVSGSGAADNQNHRRSRWYAPRLQGDDAGSPTRALKSSPSATTSQAAAQAAFLLLILSCYP